MKKITAHFFIFAALLSLNLPAQGAADEIRRSQRLSEIFADASRFQFTQLEEFYLPQLSRSAWALAGQRVGLVAAAFPPLWACGAASIVCAEVLAPVLFYGTGVSAVSVGMSGLSAMGTNYAGKNFLREEQPQTKAYWPRDLLKENLNSTLFSIFIDLNARYFSQLPCDPQALPRCRGLSLEDVEEYLTDFDNIYAEVITQLRQRVAEDPSISLEVNSVWDYLNKPGRYQKYFKYLSLITYLDGLRYGLLSDLHALRAELLISER